MRSKDLKPILPAKLLVIGEDSNLQWSDTVTKVAMFSDYFFKEFPEDHGERSRNVESQHLFKHINYVTNNKFKNTEIYITNLCNDYLTPAPKGKRVLIDEEKAQKGLEHIEWILEENPSIEYVLVMSLQSNYWLQKLSFYGKDNDKFLYDAQPRRKGLEDKFFPFYQPVNGKSIYSIIGNIYDANNYAVKIIPLLSHNNFPFTEKSEELYGEIYNKISSKFEEVFSKNKE